MASAAGFGSLSRFYVPALLPLFSGSPVFRSIFDVFRSPWARFCGHFWAIKQKNVVFRTFLLSQPALRFLKKRVIFDPFFKNRAKKGLFWVVFWRFLIDFWPFLIDFRVLGRFSNSRPPIFSKNRRVGIRKTANFGPPDPQKWPFLGSGPPKMAIFRVRD